MYIEIKKNQSTYIVFPICDADGDFVSGAAGLDSEISYWEDGTAPSAWADCSNEATENGSSGVYSLLLTAGETNHGYFAIQIKTTTTGAKTQILLFRGTVGDPVNLATTQSGRVIDVSTGGAVGLDFANIEGTHPNVTVATNNDKTGYSISGTKQTLDALNDLSESQVNAQVEQALIDIRLDELISVAASPATPTIGSFIDKILNKDGNQTFDPTTDSLEAIKDSIGGGGTDWSAAEREQIRDALGVDGTKTAATGGDLQQILAKLPTNYIMGSSVQSNKDDEIDAIKAITDLLTLAAIADAIWDEAIAGHTTAGTFGAKNQKVVPSETLDDYKANVSSLALESTAQAIKTKTNNLPADTEAEIIKIQGTTGLFLLGEYHHDVNDDNDYIDFWQFSNETDLDNETKGNAVHIFRMDATYSSHKPTKVKWKMTS